MIYRIRELLEPEAGRSSHYAELYQRVYRKLYGTLKELNHTISRSF